MNSSSIARENRRKRLRQDTNSSTLTQQPSSIADLSLFKNNPTEKNSKVNSARSSESKDLDDGNQALAFFADTSFINFDISSQPIAKIYIEEERGFRAINASQIFQLSCPELKVRSNENSPMFQALRISKCFHKFSNFCHGLLGGLSFLYLFVLLNIFRNLSMKDDMVKYFSFFSKPVHNIFNFLCIICCVSVFDRLDVSNLEGFFKLIRKLDFKLISFFIYPICLLLSLSTANVYDKFTALENNLTSLDYSSFQEDSEIFYWKTLSISKCFGSLLGWIVISLDQNFNRYIYHLKNILYGTRNKSQDF